jgi:hemolysin III
VAALVILVVFAALSGSAAQIVGFAIFGAGLVVLYIASSLFHWLPRTHRAKEVFHRLDHSCIYALIAASYTPLTFMLHSRAWGWALFGIIWGLAVLGIVVKAVNLKIPDYITLGHYLAMGWLVLIALKELWATFPTTALFWLLLGGLAYSAGTIFYAQNHPNRPWRLFNYHDIFHILVMAGSFCHFWFMKSTIGAV